MLSKPGSTIRKLVSPKKTLFVEKYEGSYFHHDDEGYRSVYRELKMRSWGLRRSSKPDLDVPKKEDLHKILTFIPPLPDTPLSSRSSLSSCGYSTDHTSPQCSSQRVGSQSPQRSPLLCPEHLEHQPQQTRGRSKHSSTSPRTPPRTPITQEVHQIILLPPSPPLQQDEPKQDYSIRRPSITLTGLGINHQSISTEEIAEGYAGSREQQRLPSNGYSNDIQQLIPEMDREFQPQRSPIEIKLPLPALVIPPTTYYSANHTKPLTPVHTPSQWNKARRRSQASLQSFIQPSKRSFLLTSPARFASASRTKRKKSKKSQRRPRIASTHGSKWELPDTARNLIERFNPIEADEVLPESILQEIMDRACLAHSAMNDEMKTTGQEDDQPSQQPVTPVEPFHLADLPTRIDNAGVSLTVTLATPPLGTARPSLFGQAEITRDDCATPKQQLQEDGQKETRPRGPPVVLAEDGKEHSLPIMFRLEEAEAQQPLKPPSIAHLTLSTTGPIRPVPRRTPSRQLPPLPTIPEGITSSMLTPTSAPSPGFGSDASNDDFILLKGTQYTLTIPSFRHGPIRIPKPEPPINQLAANAEDGLDWVAFQISIGSGIGDFDSDPLDYSRPSDAELNERDDIIAWFSDFGFDGYGTLRTIPTVEEQIERRLVRQEYLRQEHARLHTHSTSVGGSLNMGRLGIADSNSSGRGPTWNELRRIQHLQAYDWDRKQSHERSASVNEYLPSQAPTTHIAAHQTQQQHYLPWISREAPSSAWPIERQSRDHSDKPTTNTPYGHAHSQSWSYSPSPFPAPTSHPTARRDHSRGRSSSDTANTNNDNTPVPTSINRNQSPILRTSTPTKTPTSRFQQQDTRRPGTPQQQSSLGLTSSSLFGSSPTIQRSESPFLPGFAFQYEEQTDLSSSIVPTQTQQQQKAQPTKQTAKKIPQAIDAARARTWRQGEQQGPRHRRNESQESIKSLPQSPALNMVVSRDVNGQEYVIPMGFNLDHDLGDFLKWEAEHVAFGID
ncbi:hypothetical protein SMACR_00216 [Sordaria macrospora]|uniref:WGS project CABT00000000 data, contig 2.1 n=2 Tax=Sordaria macrospora TaxID=5147 RepID=F7VKH3_SORMK|nr:uncharacterized protein SMAC_00216 [Sordaria macrospora k-hell]KAA8636789.1 hypothetical protein SMACR_00216 [Sordaria macrospora]WPJ58959.1 hypothetical protein SMAC4_00216 [Sordaria macrospora]CCC06000.1 unnamed protein product [Sordaria macrospora k-hell]